MKIRGIITIFLFVYALNTFGQLPSTYSTKITLAKQHYHNKAFLRAAQFYSEAFFANNNKGQLRHRYDAARCWAMAGEIDSAFFQLERIANNGFGKYSEYGQITNDLDLEVPHADIRWKKSGGINKSQ